MSINTSDSMEQNRQNYLAWMASSQFGENATHNIKTESNNWEYNRWTREYNDHSRSVGNCGDTTFDASKNTNQQNVDHLQQVNPDEELKLVETADSQASNNIGNESINTHIDHIDKNVTTPGDEKEETELERSSPLNTAYNVAWMASTQLNEHLNKNIKTESNDWDYNQFIFNQYCNYGQKPLINNYPFLKHKASEQSQNTSNIVAMNQKINTETEETNSKKLDNSTPASQHSVDVSDMESVVKDEELSENIKVEPSDVPVKKYTCDQCFKHYSNRNSLYVHKKKDHEGVVYYCDQCAQWFKKKASLTSHIENKHEMKRFPCDVCGKSFTRRALSEHKQSIHEGIRYDCDQCDLKFTLKTNLRTHKRNKHEGHRFYCNQCGDSFTHHTTLTEHLKSKHHGVTYGCDDCEKLFNSKKALRLHKEAKHEEIRYLCSQCPYKATQPGNLKAHVRRKHKTSYSNSSPPDAMAILSTDDGLTKDGYLCKEDDLRISTEIDRRHSSEGQNYEEK